MREIEGLREVTLPVDGVASGGIGLLAGVRLRCRNGGRLHDGLQCLQCRRFVNYRPSPDRRRVTLRCLWDDQDPVAEIMTLRTVLISAAPEMRVAEAAALAREHRIHHLLVTRGPTLLGVACRCGLAAPAACGETLSDRMSGDVRHIAPRTPLAEAIRTMRTHRVGCLPVVHRGQLVGLVTRADMVRVGAERNRLGANPCPQCGSLHRRRFRATDHGLAVCINCLERSTSERPKPA